MSDREDILEVVAAVQEGDLDAVLEAVQQRIVTVNSTDPDGCSLLHWAAINNRVGVAKFLIENGADPSYRAGGVLGESPFQWAIRKRYYYMMHMLHERGFADLSFKSAQGNDALALACKLGDLKSVFLLLHWGADPNVADKTGDTPLLWLLRNRGGTPTSETVRLLLRFGANASYQNPNDGYSALHLLCLKKKIDKSLAIAVYQASGSSMASVTDSNGWTPHTLAVNNENRFAVRFLFDAILYELLPKWVPGVAAFAMVVAIYLAIDYFSPLYGGLASWALYAGTTFALFQWQLIDLRGRAIMGMFLGFLALLIFTFFTMLSPRVHVLIALYEATLAIIMGYLIYKIYTTRPMGTKCENRSALAAQIIYSAPSEGTDEETKEICRDQGIDPDQIGKLAISRIDNVPSDTAAANIAPEPITVPISRKKGGTRFVKDKFTGQLRRVDVEDLGDSEDLEAAQPLVGSGSNLGRACSGCETNVMQLLNSDDLRCRTLGPKLCGACVADRRYIVKPHMHPDVLNMVRRLGASYSADPNEQPNWIFARLGWLIEREHVENPDEVLAIATHCLQCGTCVLDQDHHSSILGNCIGKGNRRMYLLLIVISMAFFAVYFAVAKYVQQFYLCEGNQDVVSKTGLYGVVSREWCAFEQETAFYVLSFFDGCFLLYFAFHLQLQMLGITRETTLSNTVKLRYYPAVAPAVKRQVMNFLSFIYSGMYNVHYVRLGKANLIVKAAMAENSAALESCEQLSKEQRNKEKAQALLADIDERIHDSSSALQREPRSGAAASNNTKTASRRNSRAMSEEPVEDFTYERSTVDDLRPVYGDVDYDSDQDFDHFFVETSTNNYFEYFYGDKERSEAHRYASGLVESEYVEDEEEDEVQEMLQRSSAGAAARSARRTEELEHRMMRGTMNRA